MKRFIAIAAVAALALSFAIPAVADAHVTVNPRSVAANSFARLDVRVPNERDSASTTSVAVSFPEGFTSVSWKPVWGWKVKVTTVKLATPIKTDDGEITARVGRITWTATSKRFAIAPGSFEEFGLSTRIPNVPGASLRFPARQTYGNGEVVRWTGAPGSDTPAPVVAVTGPTATAAHAGVKSVSPKKGSTRDAVREVHVTFDASVVTGLIAVERADGSVVPLERTGLKPGDHAVLQWLPKAALAAGKYTAQWRARAQDGHSENGSWTFRVR
jgi:uncharacterized protein YcnI